MNGLEKLAQMFKRIGDDIPSIIGESIEETKDKFIELNKVQLLYGKDSKGMDLGIYKNDQYAKKKHAMNPLPGYGKKDYRLTGAYYNEFFGYIDDDKFIVGSMDPKSRFLEKEKDDRWGLDKANKRLYVEETLSPVLIRNILKSLQYR